MEQQYSLTKEQKEAVGLLSIGTFLEYFDLMLYVHMAFLLNDLFFPKTDPQATSLLTAFAFCSTYLLRPFGALIFGWIGDTMGRRATVIITTSLMAFSCIIMANLPTYDQIGISAACFVTICRIVQGMSSMGEIIGAELYLTEFTKPPMRYPIVALIGVCGTLGMTASLGLASIATSSGFNWRLAFWFGMVVALIGTVARSCLRETPEFIDARSRMKKNFEFNEENLDILKNNPIWKEKAKKKTILSYFLIECMWPVWFYLGYIHCGGILKNQFHFSSEQVIHQNFIVGMVDLLGAITLTYLTIKIHPLKILKVKLMVFSIFILTFPFILKNITTSFQLLLFQLFIAIFAPTGFPAVSVFFKHFPVLQRFRYASFIYALSRALMYAITSFGLVYLIDYFGSIGLLIIIIPVSLGYAFGINHFSKLEVKTENLSL